MWTLTGTCHCGAIRGTLHSGKPPAELQVRACQCSFCRKHGARAVTDPAGRLRITVADGRHLERYLFGQRTAEFLTCNRCGVYVAAIQDETDALLAVLNINTLVDAGAFTRPIVPVDFSAETSAERQARRKAKWTPGELAIGTPSAVIAGEIGAGVPA